MKLFSDDKDKLIKIRHSAEHVLHWAATQLYPGLIRAMGPATDEGFYFDFEYRGKISEADFPALEAKMQEIIDQNLPITKEIVSEERAKELFSDNPYKLEWIELAKQKGEKLSVYWTGKPGDKNADVDLCSGPHVRATKEIGAVKLLSIAGAYWHGDEHNKMLTRIYGTAFQSKEELADFISKLELAKERDHRKLGKELDLFTFSEEVGPGLPLWTPNGTIIREELEKWAKETEEKWEYVRVATPHIAKHTLYELSGHLPYYKDDMYSPMTIDNEEYYLKGMNCPHHHMIFKSQPKSYKDLPLRYAEYGTVYRYEQSGSLFGLMRVRSIAQNDAHIYCSLDEAEHEFLEVLKLHEYYYNVLGLKREDYFLVVGLPDPKKTTKYHGDKSMWDTAEKMMRAAIKRSGLKCVDDVGGAAFYGPKVDFNIISSIGREFSISTNQLDLYMPQRFNLEYIAQDGSKQLCAVIHRAPLGSHERFVGFLIEHFGGAFPVWLSPVQAVVIPIGEKHVAYAKKVAEAAKEKGLRVQLNDKSETMQARIRDAQKRKVPYMLIVGDKEAQSSTVSVRLRTEENLGQKPLAEVITKINEIYLTKSLDLW